MNIDLFEVCDARLEHCEVRESYGNTICECDPQMAALLSIFQGRLGGRLGQDGLRCVASEKCGGGELDGWQQWKVAGACRGNPVHSAHLNGGAPASC